MRLSVAHTTVYRYDRPVQLEPHLFRLRPREDAVQRLLDYRLDLTPPPAGQSWSLDQDGNAALQAWFHDPVEQLTVSVDFAVETLRENPFDFVLASPVYDERLRAALSPYLPSDDPAAFAGLAPRESDPMAFLTALNGGLFRNFRHVVRENGPAHPPEVTLREGAGSCRDLAVLFCAACRARGLAARFVSGYERAAAFEEQAHMHAWAEVYLPGGGWRGYDPSRGLAVSTGHIAVAAAADPQFAAPVTGTYRGLARSTMEHSIRMQAGA